MKIMSHMWQGCIAKEYVYDLYNVTYFYDGFVRHLYSALVSFSISHIPKPRTVTVCEAEATQGSFQTPPFTNLLPGLRLFIAGKYSAGDKLSQISHPCY